MVVVVTPDLHRIHHSALESEINSNYGGITPLWDRLLGTYTDQPRGGHEAMTVGLQAFQCSEALRLRHIYLQPFKIFRT
jgi:sterol desaturase/sphingolipid hydroxylase (fatty acid hydroxylase superfamily)